MELITTKFYIPSVPPDLVKRPRLLGKLKAAINYSLVLVSAPAGFGKTTLLSEWISQSQPPRPVAWFSVEATENDPIRFWEYVIAALKIVQSEIGETTLSLLHSPQPMPIESALIPLINELASISIDSFLVLDDYHFITSEQVQKGVTFLLEHLPARLHLVIATRVDPPLPLSRFRAKGAMLEIGANDLRFTTEESAEFFTGPGSPALSSGDIEALNMRAEGWVAGLKLAMLSLKKEKDVSVFISSFSGSQRYIMDYLLEEVLKYQPSETYDFLLKTSVLERLTGPLCDAITGSDNSRKVLLGLEKQNLFIAPLDNRREWYRYHHLFAELLRHRLEIEQGKEKMNELRTRASRWSDENGYRDEAIGYALAASDWGRAMDLVVTSNYQQNYRWHAVSSWLGRVPRDVLFSNPAALVTLATCQFLTGRPDTAWELTEAYEKSDHYNQGVAGHIAGLRAWICGDQHKPGLEKYATSALSLLPPGDFFRPMILMHLGVNHLFNLDSRAEPVLKEAYEGFQHLGNTRNAGLALASLAMVHVFQGELRQADTMLKDAIRMAGEHTPTPAGRLNLAYVYYHRNELDAAGAELESVLQAKDKVYVGHLGRAHLDLLKVRVAQGDIAAAEKELEEAGKILLEQEPAEVNLGSVAAYSLAIAAVAGNEEEIERRLDEFAGYEHFRRYNPPPAAMYLLYKRRGEAAMETLEAEYQQCRREGFRYICCITRLEQVAATADYEQALSFLKEALVLARPEGIIRLFVDFGIELAPLLRKAIKQGIEPEFARTLLHIIEEEDRQKQARKKGIAEAVPADILSERELGVLRLVADGASNMQIADKLSISLATVKTHVHHIIDKLEVRDRSQAVYRARELKLL